MRVLQLSYDSHRFVGIVEGDSIRLTSAPSVVSLAQQALSRNLPLSELISSSATTELLDYSAVESGATGWRFLPCADHPSDPARTLVSGTGLTHASSAANRQAMHSTDAELTDSMKMYRWGVEGGRPPEGQPGTAPEWFYKGPGTILRAHLEPLTVPWHGQDGGEEPEIAGVYFIDDTGAPRRLGFAQGNEFSDHVHERRNYLYLAESKLRECSLGPELVLDPDFNDVPGEVRIERAGAILWSKQTRTGEAAMSHSLANIEHHHFKHAQHRRPGDLHIHYFGTGAFSFGDGIRLQQGDIMHVSFDNYGRPLRNPIAIEPTASTLIATSPL